MTVHCTIPKPAATFRDPVTGVTMHRLFAADEPAVSLHFTVPSWTADGRYFLFLRKREGAINYWTIGPDGEERQLTAFARPTIAARYLYWANRKMYMDECDRFSFLWPAIHPSAPEMVFVYNGDAYRLKVDTGECERIYFFNRAHCEMPFFACYPQFTADGKHLLFSTAAHGNVLDPGYLPNNTDLRDESTWEGRIWRYDYTRGVMECAILVANGEPASLLACPWDPELMVWANYKHKCLYAMRRDGSGLRNWFMDAPEVHPGHFSWDPLNRSLITLMSNPAEKWFTTMARIRLDSGEIQPFKCLQHRGGQFHQNTSPDGRWIVVDGPAFKVGEQNGLHLIDAATDALHPLCQLNATWAVKDENGESIKTEWLHVNPGFSPDGRYVVCHNDAGGRVPQIWMVDLASWKPR